MSKSLENLKKVAENKSATIRNDVMLLYEFYGKTDFKTQQFIDTLLRFHKAIPDKAIKEVSVDISVGNVVDKYKQVFCSNLRSIFHHPSVAIDSYIKKEPILIVKNKNDSIVTFNLTDIEIVSNKIEEINGKNRYSVQLHSKHNNIDYSIVITIKEDK